MATAQQYEVSDFDQYFDRGAVKICFVGDKHPGKLLKLSPLETSTQILREINYFEFLNRRGVTPSFMPAYYGRCSDDKHVGFVQELLTSGEIVSLKKIVRRDYTTNLAVIEDALLKFQEEMIEKNVIILDLSGDNIMIDAKTYRVWVIDGYGTPEFIPLPKYFHFFGRLKILRQWKKFVRRYSWLLNQVSNELGVWIPSRIGYRIQS